MTESFEEASNTKLDQPLKIIEEDVLHRSAFVGQIVRSLVDQQKHSSTGLVIGLAGEWGSGKSSILNFVEQNLSSLDFPIIVLRFEPWIISGRDDLVKQFLSELVAKLTEGQFKDRTTHLREQISEYSDVVSEVGNYAASLISVIPAAGILLRIALAALLNRVKPREKTIFGIRDQIDMSIRELNIPIVVLIDEIDRIEDEEIFALLRLVKAVANFPNMSYLLAYDTERVVEALGKGRPPEMAKSRGRAFLEKIVQHQIQLPALFAGEFKELLRAGVKLVEKDVVFPIEWTDKDQYLELENLVIPKLLRTPRDVKRVLGVFTALRAMTGNEVNWVDTLGYAILLVKCPDVADKIREDPIFFSSDFAVMGSEEYLRYGIEPPKAVEQIQEKIGLDWKSRQESRLIQFLFPRFSDIGNNPGGSLYGWRSKEDSTRIKNNRALSFLVRQGLPPKSWSLEEIGKLLMLDQVELSDRLDKALSENTFADLDYVLSRRFDEFKDIPYLSFWPQFAKWSEKSNDLPPLNNDLKRKLPSLVSDIFLSAALGSAGLRSSALSIFDILHKNGNIGLLSHLLRDQVYVHGIVKGTNSGLKVQIGSTNEIRMRALDVARAWREDHLKSSWVFRSWDLNPVFFMTDLGMWDLDCKIRLANLTSQSSVFKAFVLMLFHDNTVIDRQGIESLIGWDLFKKGLLNELEELGNRDPTTDAEFAIVKADSILRPRSDVVETLNSEADPKTRTE